jgi:5-amino-6-(5-phosphoribosylamino)uracil reductase
VKQSPLRRIHPDGVTLGVEQLADELGFAERAPAERPYVVANMVVTVDGHATIDGRSGPIGGPADRALFHALRGRVDAVMAGIRTLEVERYGRLVADPAARRARAGRGLAPDPLACVITRSGRIPAAIPLLEDPSSTLVVLSHVPVDLGPTGSLAAAVRITQLEDPSLTAALAALRTGHGVRSLLCEGGPTLLGALVAAGLVDELFLTVAPRLAGGRPAPSTLAGAQLAQPAELELVWALESQGELMLRYRITR